MRARRHITSACGTSAARTLGLGVGHARERKHAAPDRPDVLHEATLARLQRR